MSIGYKTHEQRERIPDYVKHCYTKHVIPDPITGEPKERRFTCNNFRLCRTCMNFRTYAHKDEIDILVESNDEYWLVITSSIDLQKRIRRSAGADNYKRYPLDNNREAFVISIPPSEFMRDSDNGRTRVSELNNISEREVKNLVRTPKGNRVSGNLFTTNERKTDDEEGFTLHLSSPAPKETKGNKEIIDRCIAKTMIQASDWQPKKSNIESYMQSWLNLLRDNYKNSGIDIVEDKDILVRVTSDNFNWIDFSNRGAIMSIKDIGKKTALDVMKQYNEGKFQKMRPPGIFQALGFT